MVSVLFELIVTLVCPYLARVGFSSRKMHLWRKMRRIWLCVSSNLKPHKPTGGKGGGRSNASTGLLKLQDDVNMCGYKDVQVMWNLLNTSQIKQRGAAAATTTTAAVSHNDHTPANIAAKKDILGRLSPGPN